MENEKPDIEEEVEQVSSIAFNTSFKLKPGALDGISIEDAKKEIAEGMKEQYAALNPFSDGETTIIVDITMVEVCAQVNLNDLEGSQLGESCDPKSELVRKRRGIGELFKKGGDVLESTYRKITEPVVNIYCELKSKVVNEAYSFGKKQALTFSKKVEEISLRIADETVNVYKKIEGFGIDTINFFKKAACRTGQAFGQGLLGKLVFQKTKDAFIPLITSKAPDNISFKLHQWMRYLPKTTRNLPLTMIAIPGTHDSATHTMKTDHKTSPDSDLYQKNLVMSGISNSLLRSLGVNGIVSAWGKCVKHTIEEQLLIGIRSFDFR